MRVILRRASFLALHVVGAICTNFRNLEQREKGKDSEKIVKDVRTMYSAKGKTSYGVLPCS